jgi:hypothetical protein
MNRRRSLLLTAVTVLAVFVCSPSVARAQAEIKQPTVVIAKTFQVTKPGEEWDTQKTNDHAAPFKFVLHKSGANPTVWLRYDQRPQGKTAHDYVQSVQSRLVRRGITDIAIRTEVTAGRNVTFISGIDKDRHLRYLVGVWWNKDSALNLECTTAIRDFAVYEPQCMNLIRSVKILGEGQRRPTP